MPDRPESIEIDINDTSLIEGDVLEFDLKEDFQARSAPPPGRNDPNKAKLYKFRMFIDDSNIEKHLKDGFDPKDPNGYYYKKQVVCKIQDEKWQDSVVYWNASSGIPKGKKISSMLGMMQYLRVKIQPRMSELAVAKLFIKALQKLDGPIQIAECDWACWDSNDTKRNDIGATAIIAETGKVANTMLNFPKKADGGFQHIVHTKQGLELVAKLKIIRWIAPAVQVAPVNGEVKQVKVVAPIVVPIKTAVQETLPPIELGDDGEVVIEF